MALSPIPRRDVLALAVLAALPAARAQAASMTAPDVVVYCDTTLTAAMRALGAAFRRRSNVPVRVFGGPGPQSLALIAHGTRNDVLVTRARWMDDGAARGLVKAATRTGDWGDPIVLAGRGGAALAALPSAAALSGMLSGAKLGVIDPTRPGGADGVALAGRLGWRADLAGAIDGPGVAFLVRTGAAGAGLMPRSAALQPPVLSVLATVPDAVAAPDHYAAAISKNALSRNSAAFVAYLATPDATAILRDCGLEVVQ